MRWIYIRESKREKKKKDDSNDERLECVGMNILVLSPRFFEVEDFFVFSQQLIAAVVPRHKQNRDIQTGRAPVPCSAPGINTECVQQSQRKKQEA